MKNPEPMHKVKPTDVREPMDDFERMLKRALRPVNAPATLAKFLASATEAKEHQRRTGRFWFTPRRFPERKPGGKLLVLPWPPAWIGSALAAMLLLGVLAGEQVHGHYEREQSARQQIAQQQFETAVRVTDRALDQTRQQLATAGLRFAE